MKKDDSIEFLSCTLPKPIDLDQIRHLGDLDQSMDHFNKKYAQDMTTAAIFDFKNKGFRAAQVIVQVEAGCTYEFKNKKGDTEYRQAFPEWLKYPNRNRINSYVMQEGHAFRNGVANVFAGFPDHEAVTSSDYEAIVGDIHNHVTNVICMKRRGQAEALFRILAWQIQNIGQPSRIIILVKSDNQQTGKGIFFNVLMGRVWGPAGIVSAKESYLFGRFTGHLCGKSYLACEEVGFSGDPKTANIVKDMATAPTMLYEYKGTNIGPPLPCGYNLVMLTNSTSGAHIEEGDARYFLIDMRDSPSQSPDVIDFAIRASNNPQYPAVLFHYLRNLKLPYGYLPVHDIKFSDDKKDFIRTGTPYSCKSYLTSLRRRIPSTCTEESTKGVLYVITSRLYDDYIAWVGPNKHNQQSDQHLSKALDKAGFPDKERFFPARNPVKRIKGRPMADGWSSSLVDHDEDSHGDHG